MQYNQSTKSCYYFRILVLNEDTVSLRLKIEREERLAEVAETGRGWLGREGWEGREG